MARVKPFKCVRPTGELVSQVAALPYDVYSREEAKTYVADKPYSFLNIDRPETAFDRDFDMYSEAAYERAAALYKEFKDRGIYIKDADESYYLYELTMNGRSRTGIVGLASVDDYLNNVIKKHENTRADKEADRISHIDRVGAQTGPIFLAYRRDITLEGIIAENKLTDALYDFVSEDGIRHRVWKVNSDYSSQIQAAFAAVDSLYIADGHHRAASAVKVAVKRRLEAANKFGRADGSTEDILHGNVGGTADTEHEYDYFLSVIFDESELSILPYNRIVCDTAGRSIREKLALISKSFDIEESHLLTKIENKNEFGMLSGDRFYLLRCKKNIIDNVKGDAVRSLDVSILQEFLLEPVFEIADTRTDKRIEFAGGIRGVGFLEDIVRSDNKKEAFLLHPTSMEELFAVADEGRLMPPKSTWFEPKLRSGIFIHEI